MGAKGPAYPNDPQECLPGLAKFPENNIWRHSKHPPGNFPRLTAGNALNAPNILWSLFMAIYILTN